MNRGLVIALKRNTAEREREDESERERERGERERGATKSTERSEMHVNRKKKSLLQRRWLRKSTEPPD